ncbi:MAG: hypothetical protein JSS31_06455 [Proteobacteria bacterium]|nr:hypothetical protein [Pseudomonadota bacterium]MBS0493592.1 hypothetical protein [Pseudomonadota bacterium]
MARDVAVSTLFYVTETIAACALLAGAAAFFYLIGRIPQIAVIPAKAGIYRCDQCVTSGFRLSPE